MAWATETSQKHRAQRKSLWQQHRLRHSVGIPIGLAQTFGGGGDAVREYCSEMTLECMTIVMLAPAVATVKENQSAAPDLSRSMQDRVTQTNHPPERASNPPRYLVEEEPNLR